MLPMAGPSIKPNKTIFTPNPMATRIARLPRLTDHKVDKVLQQLITFDIRGMGFLLPIDGVHRAIVFDHHCNSLKYINFEGDLLPVLSVERDIFNQSQKPTALSQPQSQARIQAQSQQQIALIVKNQTGPLAEHENRIALPIDSPPSLYRIAESDLLPLPKTYEVKCVDGMTKATAEQPLRFLLNPTQLVESQANEHLAPEEISALMLAGGMMPADPLETFL